MSDQSPPPATNDLTGSEIANYRVLRRIGSGGMADVYLAEQKSLGRNVALKVLQKHLAADAAYVQRFQNEARSAAALVHANIVQIYEVGRSGDVHFIAQEFVRGRNLAEVMQKSGALEPRLVLDILRYVLQALNKAAEAGIVHRDLKPENILLSDAGEVKVADFGLARALSTDTQSLTQEGIALGTPLYMSPEQIEGRPLDVRSDIYSLGVTCFHLLAGKPPHTGETALAIAVQHLHQPPEPLENVRQDVPHGLARIVHRMFAKQPENRFATPSELLAELRELAHDAGREGWADGPGDWSLAELLPTAGSRPTATKELAAVMHADRELASRRRRWLPVAGVLAAALIAGLVLGAVTHSGWLLAGVPATQVDRRDSAWAQLYYAMQVNTEAGWKAVWENFPQADPYPIQLAQQGLVRFYLLEGSEPRAALRTLAQLERVATDDPQVAAFVAAGRCIALAQQGNHSAAREAYSGAPEMRDALRNNDPQMFALLETALEQIAE